jgi:hypothetical protein
MPSRQMVAGMLTVLLVVATATALPMKSGLVSW